MGLSLLELLLIRRFHYARILGWGAAVAVGLNLAYARGWPWYLWIPACFIAMNLTWVLWGLFLGLLERRELRRQGLL